MTDLLRLVAEFVIRDCDVCHGLGVYVSGWTARNTVVQKPCYACGPVRDALQGKIAPEVSDEDEYTGRPE